MGGPALELGFEGGDMTFEGGDRSRAVWGDITRDVAGDKLARGGQNVIRHHDQGETVVGALPCPARPLRATSHARRRDTQTARSLLVAQPLPVHVTSPATPPAASR
jgi:hypothetical protein